MTDAIDTSQFPVRQEDIRVGMRGVWQYEDDALGGLRVRIDMVVAEVIPFKSGAKAGLPRRVIAIPVQPQEDGSNLIVGSPVTFRTPRNGCASLPGADFWAGTLTVTK